MFDLLKTRMNACRGLVPAVLLAAAMLPLSLQPGATQGLSDDEALAQIETALSDVWAIDSHTHIVYGASYDERCVGFMPLAMRQDMTRHIDLIETLFGTRDPAEAAAVRKARVEADGNAYCTGHLDATKTRIAVVNTMQPFDDAGGRLMRVPFASYLLFPVPADNYPHHPEAGAIAKRAATWLAENGGADETVLADLDAYLAFVDATLAAWGAEGAVGIKFIEGLSRPLYFSDVAADEAKALFHAGLAAPLSRGDYLRLQDHIARHIFMTAPKHGLSVHIHVGAGNPPFLRLGDNAVSRPENIFANPRFFGTQFVMIHGGFPQVQAAAYQSLRPNVWIDISAQAHFVPLDDLTDNLRTYLSYSPQSVLFGTDVSSFPSVPGGPEVQHHVLSARLRDALNRALARMVAQGEVSLDQAISIGEEVLHANAERLFKLPD